MPKKKTGWRARPTVLVDGWRCPAGRARDMHPLCCPPATRRKAHGPGQVGAAPPPPPRAKMAGGPTRRPGECNVDLQIPPFRPQSPTASVFGPSRNPLHRRHPPSAVHCPRSTVRSPLWMPTRHSFAIFPASSRLQVNEIRLRRRTAEPSTSTSSPPRQSPTVPRTPARHHTQARLASPTTLTPLLFPLGAHPHHSSRFKH